MNFNRLIIHIFPALANEMSRVDWAATEISKISAGESLLDVGAGECRFKKYCMHLNYVSQDFGKYHGQGDNQALQMGDWDVTNLDIVSDITKIPVKDFSFDNVLCTAVLEHVPYPDLAVKEMSRVLKKGGKMILSAPFCSQTHFSPFFFSTGFSIYWYKKILSKYNFKIIKMQASGNFFDYLCQEMLRFPLVVKQYSFFGILSYLLYPFILPWVLLLWLISKLSKGSEKQLCFGWNILAIKK